MLPWPASVRDLQSPVPLDLHVQKSPHSQSRGDRGARNTCLPRTGHCHGGGLLGRRPHGAARAQGGRGLPYRPRGRPGVLPQHRESAGGRPPERCRRHPPGLRLLVGERRLRPGLRGREGQVHRPDRRRHEHHGLQDQCAPGHGGCRSALRARKLTRPYFERSAGGLRESRLSGDAEGCSRRRGQGDAPGAGRGGPQQCLRRRQQ